MILGLTLIIYLILSTFDVVVLDEEKIGNLFLGFIPELFFELLMIGLLGEM